MQPVDLIQPLEQMNCEQTLLVPQTVGAFTQVVPQTIGPIIHVSAQIHGALTLTCDPIVPRVQTPIVAHVDTKDSAHTAPVNVGLAIGALSARHVASPSTLDTVWLWLSS